MASCYVISATVVRLALLRILWIGCPVRRFTSRPAGLYGHNGLHRCRCSEHRHGACAIAPS